MAGQSMLHSFFFIQLYTLRFIKLHYLNVENLELETICNYKTVFNVVRNGNM